MRLYIDPGTGSMLFTILISILGVVIYAFRNVLVKIRFMAGGGRQKKTDMDREPFVFFTDSKRYQSIFKPLCDEMEKRGEQVLYLTASPDDPLLSEKYEHVKCEFAGEGNKAFARMNFLKADVVLSSTPGLDVYQWKRSRDVKKYVHIFHAPNDITLYRMFGIDYYDALLLNGEFQVAQARAMEKIRDLPEKETVLVGSPQLDDLAARLRAAESAAAESAAAGDQVGTEKKETTVLLAPSWGPSGIFSRFGKKIIENLVATGYRVILRPHPQSLTTEKELIDSLRAEFPDGEKLEWNFDNDNFEVLRRSDILISDFSGVVFDFALVFDRPVIYADVSFDKGVYDAWWLEEELWTYEILPKIGVQLTEENIGNIGAVIEDALHAPALKEGRDLARQQAWVNPGKSVEAIADYLVRSREQLAADAALAAPAASSGSADSAASASSAASTASASGEEAVRA